MVAAITSALTQVITWVGTVITVPTQPITSPRAVVIAATIKTFLLSLKIFMSSISTCHQIYVFRNELSFRHALDLRRHSNYQAYNQE